MTKSNRLFQLLCWIGFFGIFSTTISKNPVLPLFVKSLGSGDTVIGLISAVSPFAGILFSFPVGLLADRLGRKRLLLLSAAVFIISPLLYIFITNAFWLIPVRFFHGIATAILGPVASAALVGEYPETKGEKLGLYSSVTLVGRTIAPIAGGIILSVFAFLNSGWNYRFVYLLAFLVSLPIALFVLTLDQDSPSKLNGSSGTLVKKIQFLDFLSSLFHFVKQGRLFSTGIVEMATYFCFGAFETFLPLYLQSLHVSAFWIGMIFSSQILAIALSKPLFGKMADRVDKRIQILAGILIIGLSLILLPFSASIALIIGISLIFGLGMSLSTVATSSYVGDISEKNSLGASMGALSSIKDIGHSSGPFIAGIVIAFAGRSWGFYACSLFCILSAVWFTLANWRKS
jgi:MFS family permease